MSSAESWTAPGADLVAEGVYRIPLPLPMDGLKAVNVYALETDSGVTLVDGGWAIGESQRQLEESLAEIGYHPHDIVTFLVTHAHRDHYTQASAIRARYGRATIALGAGDRPTLDRIHLGWDGHVFARRLRACGAEALGAEWAKFGMSNPDPEVWHAPDNWLEGSENVHVGSRVLQAIPTPGHTSGHFVFADLENGLLFAGDHVLPNITPSVGFEAHEDSIPLRDYLESLAKVKALPDLEVLPAHGPTGARSHERVEELLSHHDARLTLSLAAVASGLHTPHEVAKVLPWTRRERRLADLDSFNAGMAVLETKSHLDLLAVRGQVVRQPLNGVWWYHNPQSQPGRPSRLAETCTS